MAPPKANWWGGNDEADPWGFHSQQTVAADTSNRLYSGSNETAVEARNRERLTFRNDRDRDLFARSSIFQNIPPANREFLLRAAQRANARIVYDAPQPERSSEDVGGLVKKVEFSPNSMAKCKSCQKKIEKKSERIGIPEWYARYQKHSYHYYHLQCCPDHIRNTIPNIRQKLKQQKQKQNEKSQIVRKRYELVVSLKELRLTFAKRLHIPAYCIFNDEVLNEIVAVLPGTKNQLLNISGIGPAKLQNFGTPILSIIRQYKNNHSKQRQGQRKTDSDSNNDDDDIAIGQTLTCEQLVQQKFDHAAANGYVIALV
jgi:superfamily II DNA helicase RecQ